MSVEVIGILVRTLGVAVVAAAIAVAKHYAEEYKVTQFVKKGVQAAEILFDVPKSGPEKKAWVKDKIKKIFKQSWVTDEYIDLLLEAAVSELKRQ